MPPGNVFEWPEYTAHLVIMVQTIGEGEYVLAVGSGAFRPLKYESRVSIHSAFTGMEVEVFYLHGDPISESFTEDMIRFMLHYTLHNRG